MLVFALTALTLTAFAANSLLCRAALGGGLIDPVSFTAVRLVSGAALLIPLSRLVTESAPLPAGRGSWRSGLALFFYAAAFSLAYVTLDTGMGALILFGAVQATMIGSGLRSGERPLPAQWLGMALALGGLLYLVWPGLTAPHPLGAVLMMISGIAWGVYSIRGRGVLSPVAATAGNFLRASPPALVAALAALATLHLEAFGLLLALISGTLTSGLGYIVWYKVLPRLTTTQAAVVQLLVPVLAALGGILLLAEPISIRLLLAGVLILGGVGLAVITGRAGPAARWRRKPGQGEVVN